MGQPSWRVNSYGYPNPFDKGPKAARAWQIFATFAEHTSYRKLKTYWAIQDEPLSSHAVESWKANLEECGLLYVLGRDDNIVITPAGAQLLAAASRDDRTEFAWVGTNLILRYPLRGTEGRSRRSDSHKESDIQPYWLTIAAALELEGLWRTELFRVLGGVFRISDVSAAIETIREARLGNRNLLDLPNLATKGAAYNSLNQIGVKASLNNMTLEKLLVQGPYSDNKDGFWSISSEYRPILELALGGKAELDSACSVEASTWTKRMPSAPLYMDEQEYFEKVGAEVIPYEQAVAKSGKLVTPTVNFGEEVVHLLDLDKTCVEIDSTTIEGPVAGLCSLVVGGRVLLNTDVHYTYLVESKTLQSGSTVRVKVRRARKIQNPDYVVNLFLVQKYAED